jgi:hypothetical protein
MKILLDECVPWPMHRLLTNHTCTSVQAQGWSGIETATYSNGLKASSIYSSLPIRIFVINKTSPAGVVAILELSTNDLRRVQAAGSLIEAAITELSPVSSSS